MFTPRTLAAIRRAGPMVWGGEVGRKRPKEGGWEPTAYVCANPQAYTDVGFPERFCMKEI